MWLQRNPMLPQTAMGQYTDSQYAQDMAQAQHDLSTQYADILQQLGYVDQNGNFIQGSVESQANRQQADLQRQMQLADEQVTQQHQQLGTLFSGLRGTDQARAEYPMVTGISDLMTQTPLTLQQLYEKAGGLVENYNLAQNQALINAAGRRSAALTAAPPGDTTDTSAPSADGTDVTGGFRGTGINGLGPGAVDTGGMYQPTGATGAVGALAAPAPAQGHYDPNRGIWVQGSTTMPKSAATGVVKPAAPNLVTPVAPGRVQIINGRAVVR
jgi:hypothetical protein